MQGPEFSMTKGKAGDTEILVRSFEGLALPFINMLEWSKVTDLNYITNVC